MATISLVAFCFGASFAQVYYSGYTMSGIYKPVLSSMHERMPVHVHARQNLSDFSNVEYPFQTTTTAEIYLGRLAEEFRHQRKVGGVIGLVVGTALGVGGVALMSYEPEDPEEEEEDFNTLGKICLGAGVLVDAVSIYGLMTPSRPEREYDNVLSIEDPVARERTGREALESLAEYGKRRRYYSAIGSAATGLYFFLAQPVKVETITMSGWTTQTEEDNSSYNNIMAASMGAAALFSLVWKSSEEKALERYIEEVEQRNNVALRLNINPIHRKISFIISF